MSEKIKIKTGSRISNILQSTVTYEQAFTELVKNSMQNGATFVDIKVSPNSVVVTDDGMGFDETTDANGMTGFEKYFVFGNSYDSSNGAGPLLGHMGIGGKVANDKLSDSNNTHWEIETKNKNEKMFKVTYQPHETEFLDDYEPELIELSTSNIKTKHGTIIKINNLDLPIKKNGWGEYNIKKELQDFFGHLVRNRDVNFEIILNGDSLEFDYTLPGYLFPELTKEFVYEHENKEKTGKVKFNLSLLQSQYEESICPIDSVIIISDVKVCEFSFDDEKVIKKIYGDISSELGKDILPQKAIRNLFRKLRGFVISDELSDVLDHTGMPAKDLSHHALRSDHPVTKPFYDVVYRTIIDILRGYLLLNEKDNGSRLNILANNVVKLISAELDIENDLLIDLGIASQEVNSAESRMMGVSVPEDIIGNLIKAEVENKTKNIKRQNKKKKVKRKLERQLLKKHEKKINPPVPKLPPIPANLKEVEDGKYVYDEDGRKRKIYDTKGVPYEIKPFGAGKEKVMSDLEMGNIFCVSINSENYKFRALDDSEDNLGLALHIAESVIRELARFRNPLVTKNEIDESLSDFYKQSYIKLKSVNLFE